MATPTPPFRAKTCLILGAGASVPYGLPTGSDLRNLILVAQSPFGRDTALRYPVFSGGKRRDFRQRNSIPRKSLRARESTDAESEALAAWRDYIRATVMHRFGEPALLAFQKTFFQAKTRSIDRFIQFNEETFGDIGRFHIASVLLNCEDDSMLDGDWYAHVLDEIFPMGSSDLEPGHLSVVTFNYDRSLEQFFTSAFSALFRFSPEQAAAEFAKINVVHVYGRLGELAQVPYGQLQSEHDFSKSIDLVRHGGSPASQEAINKAVHNAMNICFLGFAFADENVDLFYDGIFEGKKVFATSLGLPMNRVAEVRRRIRGIQFTDGTAADLLRERNLFWGKEPSTERPPRSIRTQTRNWVTGWREF